jgi:hypothetical protein
VTGDPATAAHLLPSDALDQLDVPLTSAGLVLGHTSPGQPVVLRLFSHRPTSAGIFAAAYVSRLLAFRALAVGAQVVVLTPGPARWQPLVAAAPPRRVTLHPPGLATPTGNTVVRPLLLCEDIGAGGAATLRRDLGGWQTQVQLWPYVTPQLIGPLRSFDLVVLARVQQEAVYPLQLAFGLPERAAGWLARMPDDTVAALGDGQIQFVSLAPTAIETAAFGPPTRHDLR